jgi:hypothetical protein
VGKVGVSASWRRGDIFVSSIESMVVYLKFSLLNFSSFSNLLIIINTHVNIKIIYKEISDICVYMRTDAVRLNIINESTKQMLSREAATCNRN